MNRGRPRHAAGPAASAGPVGLNPQQQAVVEHGDGPALVIAGAGTGKTRVLAHRTAALLRRGVAPQRLLLLTFTRKAAQALRSRVATVAGEGELSLPWCGTFHATAARLLRLYGQAVDVPPAFTILDDSDSRSLLWRIVTERFSPEERKALPAKGVLSHIHSYATNTGQSWEAALVESGAGAFSPTLADLTAVFTEYRDRKRADNALDYDDLLVRWLDLLRTRKVDVAGLFDHILVDEYQDTNVLQADILTELCRHHRNIMVVGDDAQAIYRFRGATVDNILGFEQAFPGAVRLKLEQNYRSTQAILDAANALIAEAQAGFRKELFTTHGAGLTPELRVCGDDRQQADAVVESILTAWQRDGVALEEQAVLFRNSFHSFRLELALQRAHVPYRKFGGPRFADAAHIKDTLAFLRCVENRRDETAWERVFGLLPGVGEATAARLVTVVTAADRPADALAAAKVPKRSAERHGALTSLLAGLFDGNAGLLEQVDAILEFYLPLLPDLYDEPEGRAANLRELRTVSLAYRDRRQLLDELLVGDDSVLQEADARPDSREWVTLSTIHSAKGCEWDCVYVIQLIEGALPGGPSQGDPQQLEEERRLLYVAMTRARQRLCLFYPVSRETVENGQHGFAPCRPSRFLSADVLSCCAGDPDGATTGDELVYDYEPEYGRPQRAGRADTAGGRPVTYGTGGRRRRDRP